MTMQYGYEVFHDDIAAVADFYLTVLGFEPGEETGDPDYRTVTRDGLSVGCSRFAGALPGPRKPPDGCEIVLRVPDVAVEYDRVVASGWPLEDDLQERPWGMTDFRVFDPTGQYVRITGPRH